MRLDAVAPLVVVLLAAGAVAANIHLRQDATVELQNQSAPATLAAGDTGSTTIGTSQASATTSVAALSLLTPQNVLDIDRSGQDWAVRIEAGSISGFGALDSATVLLNDGGTTETQVSVTAGLLTQATGSSLDLLTTSSTLEVDASASKTSLSDNVIEMEIVLSASGGSPELRYPYTLTIT